LFVIEKVFRPFSGGGASRVVIGHESEIEGKPFMGDSDARLKTLLPIEPAFDLAVNIFTYQPGATLPQVEIHVMEHGLLMLAGAGVYRLGNDYYPVAAGDVIWMASYCPQWFVAMGKQPARYIYYKDIHRDGLEDKR
jgi:(S)-ureidoglycine aminohydrolase